MTEKIGCFVEKVFHRERALAYPNHIFPTCGCPEALTSVTIIHKCGIKTSPGRHKHYATLRKTIWTSSAQHNCTYHSINLLLIVLSISFQWHYVFVMRTVHANLTEHMTFHTKTVIDKLAKEY